MTAGLLFMLVVDEDEGTSFAEFEDSQTIPVRKPRDDI